MPRPDPALLDPANYPFSDDIEVRFSDLDLNLHVNNVALVDVIQEARVRFHRPGRKSGIAPREPLIVAQLTIDYLGEARYGAVLKAHVGVIDIGRTSHNLATLVTQRSKVIALGTVVLVSRVDGKPAPASPEFRNLLETNRVRR